MDYKLLWSEESVRNLEEIIYYIRHKWSENSVDRFKKKLGHQLDLIKSNPLLFPTSQVNPSLRRAVLSKQTTIYYTVNDELIYLVFLHVNMQDINKIK